MDKPKRIIPPIFTSEMGASISYELLDEVIEEQAAILKACERTNPWFEEARSKVWWAIQILHKMEDRGLAPSNIWYGIQAQQSIALSDWIYDYLKSKGIIIEERPK